MTRRERLERRAELRREWAVKREAKAEASFARAHEIGSHIPMGQPILVGHHSEKGHRADIARIDGAMRAGCESSSMAAHHESKAAGIEQQLARNVFSDDEDAIEQLTAKIAKAEELQEAMKTANKIIRQKPKNEVTEDKLAALADLGLKESRALELFTPDFCGRVGFPSYAITNNGANIRRMQERVKAIAATNTRKQAAEESENGVTIEGDTYVRVTFAEKPDRAVLDSLKAAGFRWGAPSWVGKRESIPDCVKELAGMDPPAVVPPTVPSWETCIAVMQDDFANGRNRLQEISEHQFFEMLGAVPPARHQEGCYVCGEPWSHCMEGTVYYCGFDLGGDRYGMSLMTLQEFDSEIATGKLKAELLN